MERWILETEIRRQPGTKPPFLKDKTGVGEAYAVKHDLRASRIT